jgi:hypothetical protein
MLLKIVFGGTGDCVSLGLFLWATEKHLWQISVSYHLLIFHKSGTEQGCGISQSCKYLNTQKLTNACKRRLILIHSRASKSNK